MRIYVCVKQVPDTSGKVAVKADGTLDRASMQTIINPDDLAATEAALELKDATGCQVTVVTMGPPPAEGMLRELIAMGADDAVHSAGYLRGRHQKRGQLPDCKTSSGGWLYDRAGSDSVSGYLCQRVKRSSLHDRKRNSGVLGQTFNCSGLQRTER